MLKKALHPLYPLYLLSFSSKYENMERIRGKTSESERAGRGRVVAWVERYYVSSLSTPLYLVLTTGMPSQHLLGSRW